jgi:predicted transposase/invertase (TIGR01784 family)
MVRFSKTNVVKPMKPKETKKTMKPMKPKKIYQNLLNDFGFKFVFKKERFLVPFLNELLQGKEKIKSITLLDTGAVGKNEKDRRAVFDIYCQNDRGENILLEMQNCYQKYFIDRSIYYSSFLIQQQGIKGKWDYRLNRMYVVGILNFTHPQLEDTTDCISRVKLVDIKTNKIVSDKLNFFFVSLTKFTKSASELCTLMDYWLYTLIHSESDEGLNEAVLRENKFFADLLDEIKLNKLTKTEMKSYRTSEADYNRMKAYMDGHYDEGLKRGKLEGEAMGWQRGRLEGEAAGMQRGRLEGEAVGMQRGKLEGRLEGMQEVIVNALKRGLPLGDISAITNLSPSEIEDLQKQIVSS